MSTPKKYDPNNEIFVRREEFDRFFSKPIPKATFHRWVGSGRIKKARDLDGWYFLNKTLVHQKMNPVDVDEYKKKRDETPAGLKNSQLLYIAVMQSDAAFEALAPPRFEMPEMLTVEELRKIEKLQAEHLKVMDLYKEREERIIYRHGFLDALDAAAFIDGD